MIIFDQKDYAKKILERHPNGIVQRDLNILAKYWEWEGCKAKEIENKIVDYCLSVDSNFNKIIYRHKIKNAINHAKNYYLRFPVNLAVTQFELDAIQKLEDYNYQKIAFVMLCTAKQFKFGNSRKKPKVDPVQFGIFYNESFRDAVQLAQVNLNKNEQKTVRYDLYQAGLISPIITRYNVSYRINFYNDDAVPVLYINDWRNIIAFYQEYYGEEVIECCNCRTMITKRGNKHKLCSSCYEKNYRESQRVYAEQVRRIKKIEQ